MNKVYRHGVDINIAFSSAVKQKINHHLSEATTNAPHEIFEVRAAGVKAAALKNKVRWRSGVKAVLGPVVWLAYLFLRFVLRPIVYKARRYFTEEKALGMTSSEKKIRFYVKGVLRPVVRVAYRCAKLWIRPAVCGLRRYLDEETALIMVPFKNKMRWRSSVKAVFWPAVARVYRSAKPMFRRFVKIYKRDNGL